VNVYEKHGNVLQKKSTIQEGPNIRNSPSMVRAYGPSNMLASSEKKTRQRLAINQANKSLLAGLVSKKH